MDLSELLSRSEASVDSTDVGAYLQDRTVLVTGAGGSIGSELCRQISRCRPGRLLMLGRGEHSIYQIQNELSNGGPRPHPISIIGDVGNPGKMDYVFRTFNPEVVFHTAAHKHVSFLEQNPEEGVLNNVFGTQTLARIARQYRAWKFVLISTDKAVSPTSVLGATKRLAEQLLQEVAREGDSQFITVRFGNVLRSRGSVVPHFEEQIDKGGPVTVSHPEVRRYFMSLSEAVHLVLHSGDIGQSGDLCILDMGDPVRIVDLAEALIRLKGKRPQQDVEIVFTGMGPGEKMAEQMLTEAEAERTTRQGQILVCRPGDLNGAVCRERLERLRLAASHCSRDEVFRLLAELVPGYGAMQC